MTLSSLFNDGPVLNLSHTAQQSSSDFSWSDFPVVGDVNHFVDDRPLERNQELFEKGECDILPMKDMETLTLSTSACSSIASLSEIEELPTPRKMKGHKKSVSFNTYLEVREHALTIGDHPLCKDALPLSLAWEHGDTEQFDLNSYEEQRAAYRRSGNDMKLTYFERKNMLRNIAGMSESEMRAHQRMHESLPSTRNLSVFSGLSIS